MTRIAFIPIDNRPVCYDLPQMITKLNSDNQIYLPDISLLGSLSKVADVDKILNWFETLSNVDYVIVSLDTIAYGGLVSSRRSNDELNQIKNRVNRFFEVAKNKQAKVFAFSSIMRISNNNINEEEKEYWKDYGKKIFEYSYNLHKLSLKENELISDIPNEILKDYLNTRKRNFEINKYYIELKKQGLIDTLVFSKDDCAEFGLNVKEAQELSLFVSAEENIFIKTGADEIPITLISRALNKDKNIKIAPVYTQKYSINKISKYEDITVAEAVKSQIELCGGGFSTYDDCDLVLIVNNFKNQQGELVMNVFEPLFEGDLPEVDKPFFVADILNANGADNIFVEKLLNRNFDKFYGYAAWNTTGNTLGSAISIALMYFSASVPNKDMFENIQIVRFLDDWGYQSNVRKEIRDNAENLSNNIISAKMKSYEKIVLNKFNKENFEIKYSFPWNRFFEIKVEI